jgi:hypothetical protein
VRSCPAKSAVGPMEKMPHCSDGQIWRRIAERPVGSCYLLCQTRFERFQSLVASGSGPVELPLSVRYASSILERVTVEKSNFKTKNCPEVTFPSSISFCTSSPCRWLVLQAGITGLGSQLGGSIYAHPYTEFRENAATHSLSATSKPARAQKKNGLVERMQD